MPTARRQFNFIQAGGVNTWDGGTVASAIWAAATEIRWRPANEVQTVDTLNGNLVMSDGADVLGIRGEAYIGGILNYEDFPFWPQNALGTVAASVQGTASGGTAYKRVWTPAGTVEDTPRLYRLEPAAGTIVTGYIPSALLSSFEISGAPREFATITGSFWGSRYVSGTVTAGLSRRTVERTKAGNFAFYIDNQVGGTMGSTAVTDCITGFRFNSGQLWDPKNCLSGSLITTGFSEHPIQPTLDLTLQLGTLSEQLKAKYQAGSALYVRMEALGGTIGTSGTVQKMVRIDLCGQIMAWSEEGQNEAENGEVVTVTFTGINDTAGTWARKAVEYTSYTSLSTLPLA